MRIENEILRGIWEDRYRKNNETIEDNINRVSKYCAENEVEEELFRKTLSEGLFLPAGRTMSNSGIGKNLTLNNCFVAPQIKDNLDDIFDKVKLGSKTHQRGGGIGYDFSQIRPAGTPTSNDATASGAVSFMNVFNAQTSTILQGGRRGANMGVMNIYNIDIEDFIGAKSYDEGILDHFNLSVMIDDDFMNAVKNNKKIFLHHPVYDDEGKILKDADLWQISKEVDANYLWDLIMNKAYNNGEPGVFFYDNMNRDNTLHYIENIVCSNPCAEYLAGTVYGENPVTNEKLDPSLYGGACNLGSLFLHKFVESPFTKDAKINFDKLKDTIGIAVRFLDNIIDINKFPDEIYENYQKSFRSIGLGITGLGDMLVMLNMSYEETRANVYVDILMSFISKAAFRASIELAKEKEQFPLLNRGEYVKSGYIEKHCKIDSEWNEIKKDILKYGIRNAKIMSIAPTGTLSLTFGENCSSGLEPIFSLEYDRKVKMGGQSEEDIKIVKMRDYAYEQWLSVKDNDECIVVKDKFKTAMELDVDAHTSMLSKIAFHVDMSCSKTINLPTSYSFEDTKKIYYNCWKNGIKGCTIFRPNDIRGGILIENTKELLAEFPRGFVEDVSDNLIGKKRKLQTGCGTLHVAVFFNDNDGEPKEVYLSKGSEGGCVSNLTALSRIMSLAFRGGIPIEGVVDQLNSALTCPSYTVRRITKKDVSRGDCCGTAIGYALIDMYEEMKEELGVDDTEKFIKVENSIEKKDQSTSISIKENKYKCPECEEELINEGGCISCKSCGYSKCD